LVEIAALTTFIGGSSAESLALGSRGACGLPWAALSSFGSIFVVKACISACTPAWLRETIGVRTNGSDTAVGCSTNLCRKPHTQRITGEAVGVLVTWKTSSTLLDLDCDAFEDIYAFDERTAGPLRSCTTLEPGEYLRAHAYVYRYAAEDALQVKADWLYTFLTTSKIAEMYLLYHVGSPRIFWVTGVAWVYFFLAAIVLQLLRVSRRTSYEKHSTYIDVVAGRLPTPQAIGGSRKVLFGVAINPRKSSLWQAVWTVGLLVCACSLVGTYVLLTKEPEGCSRIWLIFQILWLSLRSIFFHFARRIDDMKHGVTPIITDERQPLEVNFRLLGLAVAVSKFQILNHPRGAYSYVEDAHNPTIIKQHLDSVCLEFTNYLQLQHLPMIGCTVEVSVAAVIGDTLLSSVAWLMGSQLTGMDLYDCCILVIQASGQMVLVPSCRVLSSRFEPEHAPDPEWTIPSQFLPKGSSNDRKNIRWRYWIPCGVDKWLYYSAPTWDPTMTQTPGIIGNKVMKLTNAEGVTEELRTGKLFVSLKSVKDVEDTIAQSAKAAAI
ncbi:hypothetical protein FB567DRAFT_423882, partial [Paraphoma chrysanthemicola]